MNRNAIRTSTVPFGLAAVWVFAAGCVSTPGAKPDDMSAEEHREAAAEHGAEATAHEGDYDPSATAEATMIGGSDDTTGVGVGSTFGTVTYNPTKQHLEHGKKHRRHAADHEAAASALESFEEAECANFPPETRRTCPLMGNVVGVDDLAAVAEGGHGQRAGQKGIRIRFAQGVNRDAVIAHMRCHLAFGRTGGRKGMDHCPLYVEGASVGSAAETAAGHKHGVRDHGGVKGGPGGGERQGPWRAQLQVAAGPEPGTVDLLVEDESLVEELRRRAKAHMPSSK